MKPRGNDRTFHLEFGARSQDAELRDHAVPLRRGGLDLERNVLLVCVLQLDERGFDATSGTAIIRRCCTTVSVTLAHGSTARTDEIDNGRFNF